MNNNLNIFENEKFDTNNALFKCQCLKNYDELVNFFKLKPLGYYQFTIKVALVSILFYLIMELWLFSFEFDVDVPLLIGMIIVFFLFNNYIFKSTTKKYFPSFFSNSSYNLFLYDNYVVIIEDNKHQKLLYTELSNIIESSTRFYLLISGQTDIIIITKDNCDYKCIEFLRNVNTNIYRQEKKFKKAQSKKV